MRSRAVGAVLAAIVLLGGLGVAGWSIYQAGYRQGLVESAAEVVVPTFGFFPGFGIFFGFLFLFLLFGLISRIFFWRRWRNGGAGPWSRGWHETEGSPMERKLTEWHDEAHSGRRYRSDQRSEET